MTDSQRYNLFIIGGFGHVGLPLGIKFADCGLQVALYDVDQGKRPAIEAGEMPFIEHDADPMLKRVIGKNLHIADSLDELEHSEIVFITIGTLVDEFLNPDVRPMIELAEQLSKHIRPHHTVIIRSTVYPGTSKYLSNFFEQKIGKVNLAYCPERIVQGHAIQELGKLPQIISGFTDAAVDSADNLFTKLGVECIKVTVQEAELAKLFSNAWRYIQFAVGNQFYMMATEAGADYERIYHAMTHNYSRARSFPGPGFAAGPCLLKDTLQLSAFYGNHFPLGHAAMQANEGLPNFMINQLTNDMKLDLTKLKVGILGMAFKADIDDIRDSLSYKLAKMLRFKGASVVCSDEYVRDSSFVSKEELVATCPIIIVGVPHTTYAELEMPEGSRLLDLWGIVGNRSAQMGTS